MEMTQSYRYQRIVQAKLHIDRNYQLPLDLAAMAGQAHFSKFHFLRMFYCCYRKTPHQYLMTVRIRNAQRLLEQGVAVAEVCAGVGFDSLSSFSGLFKKVTGMPPAAFLRRARRRKKELAKSPLQFVPNCFAETYGWTKNAISEK